MGAGQARLLLARETLSPERIARLEPAEQEGLRSVEAARAYAVELGLQSSASQSYTRLLERSHEQRVQVVVAARPDRLTPVTWWFPLVGRVAYRGYFDAGAAERFREELEREGLDTYVRPALLYSTLGWFEDPVPRDLLGYALEEIFDVIVHELVHESIWVKGDTPYNEALATFIAHHATLARFADDPDASERARKRYRDEARFAALIQALADDLESLYARASAPAEARAQREGLFRHYREEVHPSVPWQTPRYARFPETELSNAYVLANRAYLGDLPCFALELAALGGDLHEFVARHRGQPGRRGEESCPQAGGESPWG